MMPGVCPSVCLSVCRVPRPNSRTKGPGSPKLAGWKPITRVTVNLFRGRKVKGKSSGRLMLSQTMNHTQVGGITIFLKLVCLLRVISCCSGCTLMFCSISYAVACIVQQLHSIKVSVFQLRKIVVNVHRIHWRCVLVKWNSKAFCFHCATSTPWCLKDASSVLKGGTASIRSTPVT